MRVVAIPALVLITALAQAQQVSVPTGPAPTGIVVGSGNFFSPIVRDLDKAVTFYRGLGFDVPGQPTNAETNAPLRDMFGLPDAKMRWLIGRAPGVAGGVEIVEISGARSRQLKRRIEDPGAFTLVLTVRDLDMAAEQLHELGARVLTPGKVPAWVTVGGAPRRMLVAQDPDGHFIELVQLAEAASTAVRANENILEARVRLTVQSLDRAIALYHDALGLGLINQTEFANDHAVAAAMGAPGARFRTATLQVPQSGLMFEVVEFTGKHRSIRANIQDPGSTRMQLRVRNVDEAIAALAKFGGEVVSVDGKTVELPAGSDKIIVAIDREPDNLFIVMLGARPPAR